MKFLLFSVYTYKNCHVQGLEIRSDLDNIFELYDLSLSCLRFVFPFAYECKEEYLQKIKPIRSTLHRLSVLIGAHMCLLLIKVACTFVFSDAKNDNDDDDDDGDDDNDDGDDDYR
uniref:Uncharacterized protein n=1 Tax=Glossina palpalis gambiensis TaxID=67801 RepID=A0A1B0AXT3_9MUSC